MSKSKGTFVAARTYLDHLDPAYLRYFYATKLNGKDENIDLNPEEFASKVNSDLVGKVVNLASRTAKFIEVFAFGKVYPDDGGLFENAVAEGEAIAAAPEATDFNQAMRRIMAPADRANEFAGKVEPLEATQSIPEKKQELQQVQHCFKPFRQLAIYLSPVLPRLAEQTGELLA